ncbi:UDP-N-acetylmuramoyl-L-alanyl-D-glutamate--2,6-diaminopimelate ligase [Mycolicibacterium arabiense]|uniref:UDP-N-acetylmuramyl-tripeptide synthetase n=1 Tax=Mycolicibacterium arabiense TaxID=1286181 RepID=A0A7I7S2D2_9MYCO|nr:UDP-N-acetylmuramoyl-L-alanyl-D-glutamate--2,6-diaminopimelate ligase [Mycolicibacterium arabiense]MCV7371737.1 UDP-N-acetylmuramoyl-L-alanyl-D-glutamate--2,6-diaminopimelate ligase [Mycolicibacterium arabiense]BBY50446.1 UDP-N-acetylmuramoyl-L-alanyl-D-glutamate--2,6-diaminopimelate ligase [Mycolicibacterium arabiense]
MVDSDAGRAPTAAVSVADVAAFLQTKVIGPADAGRLALRDLVDDSRVLRPGDAYVAIPGTRWHGLDFENEAVAAGAVLAISDRPSSVLPTLIVDNPRAVVGPLAAWFHQRPSRRVRVFGVTGTNGKTSTAHFIEAGLAAAGECTGLISGARIQGPNWGLIPTRTTPEAATLQRTLAHFHREGVSACAVEVSSHAIAQRRVDGTKFRAMAFTNLSHDHLDYHGTMQAYFATKASMFTSDRTQIAVVNVDDAHGARLASNTTVPTWTCSTVDPSADVYAEDVVCTESGSRFTACTPAGTAGVCLQTLGPHQVSNAVVALTSLIADGIDPIAAAEGVSFLTAITGRCKPVHAGQRFTAIVDYMHNTAGQRTLLPYLRQLTKRRLILVVGASGSRDPSKRRPLGQVAATYADTVIVTDESPEDDDPAVLRRDVLAGARRARHAHVIEEPNRHRALELAVSAARPGDVLVVAGRGSDTTLRRGSHTSHFDDHAQLHQIITAAIGTRGPTAAELARRGRATTSVWVRNSPGTSRE